MKHRSLFYAVLLAGCSTIPTSPPSSRCTIEYGSYGGVEQRTLGCSGHLEGGEIDLMEVVDVGKRVAYINITGWVEGRTYHLRGKQLDLSLLCLPEQKVTSCLDSLEAQSREGLPASIAWYFTLRRKVREYAKASTGSTSLVR